MPNKLFKGFVAAKFITALNSLLLSVFKDLNSGKALDELTVIFPEKDSPESEPISIVDEVEKSLTFELTGKTSLCVGKDVLEVADAAAAAARALSKFNISLKIN